MEAHHLLRMLEDLSSNLKLEVVSGESIFISPSQMSVYDVVIVRVSGSLEVINDGGTVSVGLFLVEGSLVGTNIRVVSQNWTMPSGSVSFQYPGSSVSSVDCYRLHLPGDYSYHVGGAIGHLWQSPQVNICLLVAYRLRDL